MVRLTHAGRRLVGPGGVRYVHTGAPTGDTNLAPTASFTSTASGLSVVVDSSNSTDFDGEIVARAWDFGDGTTGTGVTATRTYATAGNYTVTLTVTDDDGATSTATRTVTVVAPAAPPSAPTNVQAVESPAKASLVTWDDPQAGVTWEIRDANNPSGALVAEGLTTRSRQSGAWLIVGATLAYEVRARRTSDGVVSAWAAAPPLTITGTMNLGVLAAEFDATDTPATGAVSQWVSTASSTVPITLAQTTSSAQPVAVTENGVKSVRFDGGDRLFVGATALGQAAPGVTLYGAVRLPVGAPTGSRIVMLAEGGTGLGRFFLATFDGRIRAGGRRLDSNSNVFITGTTDLRDGVWHVLTAVIDATTGTLRLYVDGTLEVEGPWQTPGAFSNTASQRMAVGSTGGGGEYLNGDIARIRAYHAVHTAAQVAAVRQAIAPAPTTGDGGTGGTPTPAPTLSTFDAMVQDARASFYPGGDGEYAAGVSHFPDLVRKNTFGLWEIIPPSEGGWPVVYWVPDTDEGDAFQAPNGEYVHRGRQFNPSSSTALRNAVSTLAPRVARVLCPVTFLNVPGGPEFTNMHGAIVQGMHVKVDQWMNNTTADFYRNSSDAEAGVNKVYSGTPRPGTWSYPSAQPNIDSGAHRQSIYAQGWTSTTTAAEFPDMGFQVWEGPHVDGQYAAEGFNWSGGNSTTRANYRLGLVGYRQERVSVYMHPSGSNKVPGGDGIQIFAGCRETFVRGSTVAKTGYQAFFGQQHQGMPSGFVRLIDVRWSNARFETDTTNYGGATGNGTWMFAAPGNGWGYNAPEGTFTGNIRDTYVWKPGASRGSLVGGTWPGVSTEDVADFVTAADVGLNFTAP